MSIIAKFYIELSQIIIEISATRLIIQDNKINKNELL